MKFWVYIMQISFCVELNFQPQMLPEYINMISNQSIKNCSMNILPIIEATVEQTVPYYSGFCK